MITTKMPEEIKIPEVMEAVKALRETVEKHGTDSSEFKSMVEKTKHKFNSAIAEVGSNDKWQKIELGVCTVGNDRRHVDASLTNILTFLESLGLAEIVDSQMEIFNA